MRRGASIAVRRDNADAIPHAVPLKQTMATCENTDCRREGGTDLPYSSRENFWGHTYDMRKDEISLALSINRSEYGLL